MAVNMGAAVNAYANAAKIASNAPPQAKGAESFGKMVVHGHSITEDIDERPNRIGIDTGAFASGRLTAIGLEGEERWYLST